VQLKLQIASEGGKMNIRKSDGNRSIRIFFAAAVAFFAAALMGSSFDWHQSIAEGKDGRKTNTVRIRVLPDASAKGAKKGASGHVSLVVLTTDRFDALTIDPATVTFAGASVSMDGNGKYKVSSEDIDGDGMDDLVVNFSLKDLQVGRQPTKADFRARTVDGAQVESHECVQSSGEPCGGQLIPAPRANKKGVKRVIEIKPQVVQAIVLAENFDGVAAPALPAGWTTSFTNGAANCTPTGTCVLGSNWVTTTNLPSSAPNAAFHNEPACVTDNLLVTPGIAITGSSPILTFSNQFNLESGFDGTVLEISTDGGATWADVTSGAIGGSFIQGGYNDTISVNFLSPIPGRMAWSGLSGGTTTTPAYITTRVNLGPNLAGKTINIRWRTATDCDLAAPGTSGQWVDDVSLDDTDCVITCPANITVSNDLNQCGAVVNYPAPTTTGTCGTITCSPASGSFFPVGTTTITCSTTVGPICTFTITVIDTQPPSITCPANVTAVSAITCPPTAGVAVSFPDPTASDNCPGVTTACVPPSGSPLPPGTTTVTCTATDLAGNTATCSFSVSVFDACLQDDSNPTNVILFNTSTGEFRACCGGTVFTGVGTVTAQGCDFTLQSNSPTFRVLAKWSSAYLRGSGSVQFPPGTTRCVITDRDIRNNSCVCQ
jgi:hypothetical protein